MNNNEQLISDLKALTDFLEARPNFPKVGTRFRHWIWSKDELKDIARKLGSFEKRYNDDNFELAVQVTPTLELVYYCDREKVCKKIVSYECEDVESILKDLDVEEAEVVE